MSRVSTLELYANVDSLINEVANKQVPEHAYYERFYYNTAEGIITIEYSWEPACECCSWDYGDIELSFEDFEELVKEHLEGA